MELYNLSLHDALPISIFAENRCYNGFHGHSGSSQVGVGRLGACHFEIAPTQLACIATTVAMHANCVGAISKRSEEHTSELQSRGQLVCRLLIEKTKYNDYSVRNKL